MNGPIDTSHPFHPTTNTIHPWQPDYQPPDYRVDPEHHFPLTAPAVRAEGTVVEKASAAFENAAAQFEKHLTTIDVTLYTPEGAKKRIEEFGGTAAAKAVDTEVNKVRELRDREAARVEHLSRELSPDGDMATEIRASRYWDDVVRILDNVNNDSRLTSVAEDLMVKADRAQLGVLRKHLLSYMQSRVEKFSFLTPDKRDKLLNGYKASIEQATDRIVPEYGKAKKRLSQAQQALDVVSHNAKAIRDQFAIAAPGAYRKPRFIDTRKFDPDR